MREPEARDRHWNARRRLNVEDSGTIPCIDRQRTRPRAGHGRFVRQPDLAGGELDRPADPGQVDDVGTTVPVRRGRSLAQTSRTEIVRVRYGERVRVGD